MVSREKYIMSEIIPINPIPVGKYQTEYTYSHIELDTINSMEMQRNDDKNFFSKNFNILDLPELQDIRATIESAIKKYQTETLGITKQTFVITDSWSAMSNPGGSQYVHNHPNSILSGVMYVHTSEDSALCFSTELQIFKKFNFWFDIDPTNIYNTTNWKVPVKRGDIIIFPSWLDHYVDTHLGDQDRVVIAFNCFVKGKFGNNRYPTRLSVE